MSEKRIIGKAETILESISDGVFTVDTNWQITFFNRSAEQITGIKREDALGKNCADVLRSSKCESDCALRQTLSSGVPVIGKTCYIINGNGKQVPISISTAVIRDEASNIVGGAETFRDLSEVEALRKELHERFVVGNIISRSPLLREIFAILPAVATSNSTVLITGETGTGKELLAHAIHSLSSRNKKRFVAVNCGAIPDTLLESELFGYKAGAFTGAVKDRKGRFAIASGGTIFLDEIGDISPALQVLLLRVLQEKEFEPLGANESEKADVRVIAATNKDLGKEVREGRFREDLFYRLNVMQLEMPPLRKRKEDIPLLVAHFISRFNALQGKKISGITRDALAVLMAHDWQGNIRELENVIERAFILASDGEIDVVNMPMEIREHMDIKRKEASEVAGDIRVARKQAEAMLIRKTLEAHKGNRAATARALNIHKTTLFRWMKKLDI
ncbi:MAG: sigma 54-interacting transcriptional regulator [Deltaproteobacteria bacterium]|nr:sigma 54-interacting transcriptional regulator [Deltaproteobacteria bacterium]